MCNDHVNAKFQHLSYVIMTTKHINISPKWCLILTNFLKKVYGIIFEKLSLGQDGPIDWGKMGTHLAPCYSAAHKSGESSEKERNKKVSKTAKKETCV